MKSVLLVLSVAMFFSCQSQKKIASQIATAMEDVYFQHWMAGVRGGGAGFHFHVVLNTPLPTGTQLLRVVFKDKTAEFTKQDALHYIASIPTKAGGRPDPKKEEAIIVLPESTRAELHFANAGKTVVHVVENVREKEMLAYPVMNKPGD